MRDPYKLNQEELEEMLDAFWAFWDSKVSRKETWTIGAPFSHLPIAEVRAIKWLLRRRIQVIRKEFSYGVLITDAGPNRCFAHPVPPLNSGEPAWPEAPYLIREGV
jgi:hypothetical protein